MITLLPYLGVVYYVTLVPQGVALGWWRKGDMPVGIIYYCAFGCMRFVK